MKSLMIDNFDSFTYNLVDEFRTLDCEMLIYRNNISESQLDRIVVDYKPDLIVLSPGPSTPDQAGICKDLIRKYYRLIPILGICLGHQCLIEAFGGKVEKAVQPVHGKKSTVTHQETTIFSGVPNPFSAGRYHSLYGTNIPVFFQVTAKADGIAMAIENREYHLYGLQFHPESILTPHGRRIIENVLGVIE